MRKQVRPITRRRNQEDTLPRLLDQVLAFQDFTEATNLPTVRMDVSLGHLPGEHGPIPYIVLHTPIALVAPSVERERGTFARYAGEASPSPAQEALIADFSRLEPALPVIVTERAWVESRLQGGLCILTVGTEDAPGWSTMTALHGSYHHELKGLVEQAGGIIVGFADWRRISPPVFIVSRCSFTEIATAAASPMAMRRNGDFVWPSQKPPPKPAPPMKPDLGTLRHTRGVADAAKALAKNKRDLLLILLAVDQQMSPVEIGKLNLDHVRIKNGRVYLKGKLIRRKAVYEPLTAYRKRDWEWALTGEPLFCQPKDPGKRLGAVAIRKILDDYTARAMRRLEREAKVGK